MKSALAVLGSGIRIFCDPTNKNKPQTLDTLEGCGPVFLVFHIEMDGPILCKPTIDIFAILLLSFVQP